MPRAPRSRTVIDRVYAHLELPPVVAAALDTPPMQRLRGLRQLGVGQFVYPGAVHTRFEHSLGVAHLARVLAESLRRRQPQLNLTDWDVDTVMLAGLAHDVGHGPFSHLFEDVVCKRFGIDFDHEVMSRDLTRVMLDGLVAPTQVDDVVHIMGGAVPGTPWPGESHNGGASPTRRILGEIVSNKRCGIDVDKLDYFHRDSLSCYGRATVDARYTRLFSAMRAVQAPKTGEWALGFEAKAMLDLREVWALRSRLHKTVYQHQTVKCVGHMVGDVLELADPHFRGCGGLRMSECATSPETFMMLGDWVLDAIAAAAYTDSALRPAADVLHRLRVRDLYPMVFSAAVHPDSTLTTPELRSAIRDVARGVVGPDAAAALIIPDVVSVTPSASDPLASVIFFNPKRLDDGAVTFADAGPAAPSAFAPASFVDKTLLVFARHGLPRSSAGDVGRACAAWAAAHAADVALNPLRSFNAPPA